MDNTKPISHDSSLYRFIDSWDGQQIFIYAVVFILILWYCSKSNIGINILVALLIGWFVLSYLNNRSVTAAATLEDQQTMKKNIIHPKLNDTANQLEPVVDFTFSIQDFYAYDPLAYELMILSMNRFYEKYNVCFIEPKTSHINYGLMEQYKRDALNAFSSIIFSLPDDPRVRNKLNVATTVLDGIMTTHLDQISYLVDEDIYKYGYNINSAMIDYGPKAFNEYSDIFARFSYDIH